MRLFLSIQFFVFLTLIINTGRVQDESSVTATANLTTTTTGTGGNIEGPVHACPANVTLDSSTTTGGGKVAPGRDEEESDEVIYEKPVSKIDDLVHLPGPLTEDAIVRALESRFQAKEFMVSIC